MRRILALALILAILPSALASLEDLGLQRVYEHCNKWNVSFEWSDTEGYSTSISHGSSEVGGIGGAKTVTDTLTMTSSNFEKVIKVSVTKYPWGDASLANATQLSARVAKAISEAGGCGNVTTFVRDISGVPGAQASGINCRGSGEIYAAVYPVGLSPDKPIKAQVPDALAVITSTYGKETTETFLNTLQVEGSG